MDTATASSSASVAGGTDVGTPSIANRAGDETPTFRPPSRISTPGSELAATAAAAAAAGAASGDLPLERGRTSAGGSPSAGRAGAAERHASEAGVGGLARAQSSYAIGESGLLSFAAGGVVGGAGATGGLKRARDRRADRRKKKDPFEALEERLLDGFSLESITKQLQQQDETLQKGVRTICAMHTISANRKGCGMRCLMCSLLLVF